MNYIKAICCNIKLYFTVQSDVFSSGKAKSENTLCGHQANYNAIFHQHNFIPKSQVLETTDQETSKKMCETLVEYVVM